MTSSILDSLTRSLGSTAYTQAANTYGESDPAVTKGFTVAVAAVLAPLVARAGNMQFMRGLLDMTREVPADVTLLDQPERLFNRAPRAVEETGPVALLRSLVFGGNPETINNGISRASGVKPSTAAAFFSVALPTVLGYLSRLVVRENLDAAGLGRRLAAERVPLVAVLPAYFGSLLSPPDVAPVEPARDRYQAARANVPAPGLSKGSSSNGWVAAAIVALLAVIGLYAMFGRSGRGVEGTPGAVGTAGYIDRVLPDGTNLRFPAESTESRFLSFLEGGTPVDRETWYEFDRITFRSRFDDAASTVARATREHRCDPESVPVSPRQDRRLYRQFRRRECESRAVAVARPSRDEPVARPGRRVQPSRRGRLRQSAPDSRQYDG